MPPAHQPPRAPPAGPPPPGPGLPWRPQFNLFTLMLLMFVASVVGAGAYYALLGLRSPETAGSIGIMLVIAAPLLLVVVLSLLWTLYKWVREGEIDGE